VLKVTSTFAEYAAARGSASSAGGPTPKRAEIAKEHCLGG
jgi:hypothetical protein